MTDPTPPADGASIPFSVLDGALLKSATIRPPADEAATVAKIVAWLRSEAEEYPLNHQLVNYARRFANKIERKFGKDKDHG